MDAVRIPILKKSIHSSLALTEHSRLHSELFYDIMRGYVYASI